jgi:hypothetical protein
MRSPTPEPISPKFPSEKLTDLKEILKMHDERIVEANRNAARVYRSYTKQMRLAYAITIISYIVSGLFAFGMVIVGILLSTSAQSSISTFLKIFSISLFMAGLILVLILLSKNPLRLVRNSTMEMIKVEMILTGYMRQIFQIDAKFQNVFKNMNTIEELDTLSAQIQSAIDQAINSLTLLLNDFDE